MGRRCSGPAQPVTIAVSNVVSTIDPRGTTTRYAYNVRNWQTLQIEAYGTALQRATTTSFDPVGNVFNVTDPNGVIASFGYDADNRQTVRVDAYGFRDCSGNDDRL